MGESLRKPHPMPEIAAFVQSLREAFGGTVDDAVAKGKRSEPGFADARTAVPESVLSLGS